MIIKNLLIYVTLLCSCFFFQCKSGQDAQVSGFHNGAKIVRGVTDCPLTAKKIADADDISVKQPLNSLSINASDDRNISYQDLAANLPHNNFAYTTLGELRKRNKHLLIVSDPVKGNSYHSLLSVITPEEMGKAISGNCTAKKKSQKDATKVTTERP